MTFPHYFDLFGFSIHPHLAMELVAYPAGFYTWVLTRRRTLPQPLPTEAGLWILGGAIFAAALGATLLAWLEHLHDAVDPPTWMGGKTVVGGLLGGWLGVEIAKRLNGIRFPTGDAVVFPLILGISIGRVGCFLTGLADRTYGIATNLPWGVDFGDGIVRHPTQLYEIAFLLVLGGLLALTWSKPWPAGRRFRLFMLGYLSFRFLIEFIKPVYAPYLGLSAIQLAALAGFALCLVQLLYLPLTPEPHREPEDHGRPSLHSQG